MITILIVIHLLIVVVLVGLVLIQKSEGGGLGIGGGSGFMTARGAANTLTRTTAILAAAFFATSLALGILARYGSGPTSILDRIPTQQTTPGAAGGTLLDKLNQSLPNSGAEKNAAPAANNAAQQPPAASTNAPSNAAPATDNGSATTQGAVNTNPSGNAGAPAVPQQSQPHETAPSGAPEKAPATKGPESQIPTGQ
ncbi:MAG TPA: preprotein translocase subunit SecG [Pararhizobium sp.]|nr:preprotein translocase subunit SecG [Pararhizobium sp.]